MMKPLLTSFVSYAHVDNEICGDGFSESLIKLFCVEEAFSVLLCADLTASGLFDTGASLLIIHISN